MLEGDARVISGLDSILGHEMCLARVLYKANLELVSCLLQDENPMLSMLEDDAAFILDVYTEVFVWYGEKAERAARRGAGKVANQLLRAVPRPRWVEGITHVREAREPFLFRVKFFDWGVAPRRDLATGRTCTPINCMTSFHKAVRTIAEVKHDPEAEVETRLVETLREGKADDLPFPSDALVEEAGAGDDKGFGQLLMWRVHPKGLVTVPEEEFGHMQSSHRCPICLMPLTQLTLIGVGDLLEAFFSDRLASWVVQ